MGWAVRTGKVRRGLSNRHRKSSHDISPGANNDHHADTDNNVCSHNNDRSTDIDDSSTDNRHNDYVDSLIKDQDCCKQPRN